MGVPDSGMPLSAFVQQSGVAFGTSGARGLVSALTDEVCAAYTLAFIQSMQAKFDFDTLAIAIDLRPSSPRIALACASMAKQLGLNVVYCGPIPTPALALYAQTQAIPGIMVTGSHIPFDRNGLKFYRPDGEISKADEAAMLACVVSAADKILPTLPHTDAAAANLYQERYLDLLGRQGLAALRLAIYQHSSVGRDLMVTLFEQLGAEVICLERSDTFVPIDTEAVSAEDRARGVQWAAQHQVDAIISTDGDGDRPLISDEQGQWLRGDIVGLLTSRALGIKQLAVPVSCNTAIEKSGYFERVIRTRIGSPYVIAAMQALSAEGKGHVAGFEANGGFLLGSTLHHENPLMALPTRDAVLPMVVLLSLVKASAKPLSQWVAELPQRYTASDRLQDFPTEKSKALLALWSANPAMALGALHLSETLAQVDETDGLRFTLASGRIVHLRPSGNAPEFRCYVEDESPQAAIQLLAGVMSKLATVA